MRFAIILAMLCPIGRADFDEQERWWTLDSGIRLYMNSPAKPHADKLTALILFTCPNGNTIEQTLGCAKAEGLDWHYDIQHIAAQTRKLRSIDDSRNLVLAVAEAPKLSWPAFRATNANAGEWITGVVDLAMKTSGAKSLVLTGHSGGGSFIFGYINAHDTIPAAVERIAFLDSNYAYNDEQKHGEKLLAWLKADVRNHLVVIAYDDREITLNDKKVVGPTGGTYRASYRMIDRFKKDLELKQAKVDPFDHFSALEGRMQFFIHPNPENKILHTALVGEMNGHLQSLTLGTALESKWGAFGGPRAYADFIQKSPAVQGRGEGLNFPPRGKDASSGSAFIEQISKLPPDAREQAILREIMSGNVPSHLRRLHPLKLDGATLFVTPDYLAIGSDDDFVRIPMTPMTAAAIAQKLDASLITKKISDAIFTAADPKLAPRPLTQDREAPATFLQHDRIIKEQLKDMKAGQLIAGIKKDIVLTNRLKEKPNKVAIYGWHYPEGKPIQPLYVGHKDTYVDYSHGVRLMAGTMIVNGKERSVAEILRDKELSAILSDEGPIDAGYTPLQ